MLEIKLRGNEEIGKYEYLKEHLHQLQNLEVFLQA